MKNNILIRVDASDTIGLGHLSRAITIAKEFRSRRIKTIFLTRTESVRGILLAQGFEMLVLPSGIRAEEEVDHIGSLINDYNIGILVTDIDNGRTFDSDATYKSFIEGLNNLDCFLISYEDFKNYPNTANMVIIPYVGAERLKTYKSEICKYLFGPQYFAIDEDFVKIRPINIKSKVENILITMGGCDIHKITLKVLNALNKTDIDANLKIIIGVFSQINDADIMNTLGDYNGSFEIVRDAESIAKEIQDSDIAIVNSGLTKYEISAAGLPGIVISNDAFHSRLMNDYAEYGSILHLGPVDSVKREYIIDAVKGLMYDYDARIRMSNSGKSLIDGKGMKRILSEIPKEIIND